MLDIPGIEIRKFLHASLLCVTKLPEWKKFSREEISEILKKSAKIRQNFVLS